MRRYDIGASGRWLPGRCACGLTSPRFELLERHGTLLRIGTDFISLTTLAQHLRVPFQLVLDHDPDGLERLHVHCAVPAPDIRRRLLGDTKLTTLVQTGLLTLAVEHCAVEQFSRNRHSGKTPTVIDNRR